MDKIKVNLKHYFWVPIFILFLVVRMFSGNISYPLYGDACTYLTLAKNFPFHTLYNHDLYLIHPPLFGWIIGVFHFFMPPYYAGLTVASLFAILSFWGTKRLCASYRLGRVGTSITLIYISLSMTYITFDSHISRVTILTFFIIMSLLNYHEYLKQGKRELLYLAMLCTGVTLFISEQGVFLTPCLGIQYLFSHNLKKNFKSILTLAIVSILTFSIWPVVRLIVYMNHTIYPAGIDGTIEYVKDFDLKAILNPNLLPLTSFHVSHFTNMSFQLKYFNIFNYVGYVCQIPFVPYAYTFFITMFIIIIIFIYTIMKKKWKILEVFIMSLFLFLPCFFGVNKWYGITMIIPFGIYLGSISVLNVKISQFSKYLYIVLYAICAFFIFYWLSSTTKIPGNSMLRLEPGHHFIYMRSPVTPGYKLNQQIHINENDGLMAPIGLVPEMTYLTNARCLALPMLPELLDQMISLYNIKYIILSDEQLKLTNNREDNIIRTSIVCNKILNTPSKYKIIATWKETYPDEMPSRSFYLFSPVKNINYQKYEHNFTGQAK